MSDYDDYIQRLGREHDAQSEVEAAKLELRLWALVRGDARAEARTRRHPRGIELVVTVGGELHLAHAFTAAQLSQMEAMAARVQRELVADGWHPAGPQA